MNDRFFRALRDSCVSLCIMFATLAAFEVALRVVDLRILREGNSERSLTYGYDAELGWAPIPNSASSVTTARTIQAQHNSLGFRDIEFKHDDRPSMLFIGDSFVWGVDAEADERFTNILRKRIPDYNLVNAGVSGYGTDQEYLLLRKLWPAVRPKVLVLVFCADNDRLDNSTNVRYDGYQKPYFATAADGTLELRGQPVPKSRQLYIKEYWLVRHLWLARLVAFAYVEIRHPQLFVPDATERIVSKIHQFVEAGDAKLVVALQAKDDKLVERLQAEQIPFIILDGAEVYPVRFGAHWTPNGQKLVADRLFRLLSEQGLTGRKPSG